MGTRLVRVAFLGSLATQAGLACADAGSEAVETTSASSGSSAAVDDGTTGDTSDDGPTIGSSSGVEEGSTSGVDTSGTTTGGTEAVGGVYVVMFTHIEDNTPMGELGTPMSRMAYVEFRERLIEFAERTTSHGLTWVLQPDWKLLEAALLVEDAELMSNTGGQNVLRYLAEEHGVVIDPHSHENGGYNYTDVAHLLELLGVGGSTVIGGHIWDPDLPQFQGWDRFREPVQGVAYPRASWRGDILIGAGTPNHVNDPLVSGLWRPADRDNFFVDDPAANVVAVGAWRDEVAGVEELVALRADGTVAEDVMLTVSWNITPIELNEPGGIDQIDANVLTPIAALRDAGDVVVTDFTSLVAMWQSAGGEANLYMP
jgi:hypothetical protein